VEKGNISMRLPTFVRSHTGYLLAALLSWMSGALLLLSICSGGYWRVSIHTAHADGGAPNLAYVSGTIKGISRIDIAQQSITGTINAGGDPHEILLSYDGRFLYVTEPASGRVAMLAARTGEAICQRNLPGAPSLLALDPINNLIYVAGNGASIVTELGSLDCSYKKTFHVQGPVYGLALAQAGANRPQGADNQLDVTTSAALDVFDAVNGQLAHTVPVPAGPRLLSVPPGATAYVTTRQGSIVAVDLHTYQMETVVSGGTYGPMDFDEDTSEVFVPDSKHDRLLILSPVTVGVSHSAEPHRVIPFRVAPISVAITSDGQFGFVALTNGSVVMLDLPGHQLLKTFSVGGTPHFIITGLYAPVIGITQQETTLYGTFITVVADAILALLGLGPILVYLYYMRKKRSRRRELARRDINAEPEGQTKEPVEH
jgi:DNA-binding beta-propeller fold protein YncE